MSLLFKKGQKVKYVRDCGGTYIELGKIYTISRCWDNGVTYLSFEEINKAHSYVANHFELVYRQFEDHEEYIQIFKDLILKHAECIANRKTYEGRMDICPLCVKQDMLNTDGCTKENCAKCPWVLITGDTCISGTKKYENSLKRIQELEEWITLYTQDLDLIEEPEEEPFEPFEMTIKINNKAQLSYIWSVFNPRDPKKLNEIMKLGAAGYTEHIVEFTDNLTDSDMCDWDDWDELDEKIRGEK